MGIILDTIARGNRVLGGILFRGESSPLHASPRPGQDMADGNQPPPSPGQRATGSSLQEDSRRRSPVVKDLGGLSPARTKPYRAPSPNRSWTSWCNRRALPSETPAL